MPTWTNSKTKDLYRVILALKTAEEAKKFFRDLLTVQEIIEFGRRWRTAQMLDARIPYSQIEQETGLSSTTIARISRWFNKGKGGYKIIIERLKKKYGK